MLHYTDISGTSSDKTGYCKYCGRPLSNADSVVKGFGDICFEKYKRSRVRKIGKVVGKTDESITGTDVSNTK